TISNCISSAAILAIRMSWEANSGPSLAMGTIHASPSSRSLTTGASSPRCHRKPLPTWRTICWRARKRLWGMPFSSISFVRRLASRWSKSAACSSSFVSGETNGKRCQMDDEHFPYITEDWRCSKCGAEIDVELIKHYDLQIDRSGVQPGTVHGPAVYWFEGTIACPGCGVRLDYSDSSD